MANNDSERERQRFADLYAGMADAELQLAAREEASLTNEARHALRWEFTRRNLEPPTAGQAFDVAEFDELVILRRFRDLSEALVAKVFLDDSGIDCFLVDENVVRMD